MTFTPSPAGTYAATATYGGDSTHQASHGAGTITAQAGGSGGSSSATVSMLGVKISGSIAKVSLKCTGPTGKSCAVTLTLSVTETVQGGKVIAVAASKKPKKKKKVVVIGKTTVTLAPGQRKTVKVSLNGAGRKLLAARHTLRAKLTITQRGKIVATKTVTYKLKPKKKKH